MPFSKAKPEQAFLKVAMYGKQGSGKTITALLFAEGLAKREDKKIAYLDTEHGTDFYVKEVKERTFHPAAFKIDTLYTKSLSQALTDIKALDFNEYGVIIIDSITHLWEAAQNAYEGRRASNGSIPMHAWGDVKRPYKELINFVMNANAHVFILGREGIEMGNVDGQVEVVGSKMKSEGETPYEPNILINMKQQRYDDQQEGLEKGSIIAYFEKDRTGLFTGISVKYPDFSTIEPVVNLLFGTKQAQIETEESVSQKDSGLIDQKKIEKREKSTNSRIQATKVITCCQSLEELMESWTKEVKILMKSMYAEDKEIVTNLKDQMKLKLPSRLEA